MTAHKPAMIAAAAVAAAAAAALASSSPLQAQCRLCGQPVTTRPDAADAGDNLQIQIETNLNFDQLIIGGAGRGAATIRPDGSMGAEGAVLALGPRAIVGTVLVHGDPGRLVAIDLPRRIDLYSLSGSRITLDDVTSDASSAPRLDAAGNLSFRFGGRLILSGDSDGQFRGDLPISVDYADEGSASAISLTRR